MARLWATQSSRCELRYRMHILTPLRMCAKQSTRKLTFPNWLFTGGNMKINVICTVLATVVVASLTVFNGCSKGGDETESLKGRITVITQRTDLVDIEFQTYRKLFEAKFPGAKVEFEAIKDYESDIVIRMQTKEYGDVFMLPDAVPSEDFPDILSRLEQWKNFPKNIGPSF